MTDARRPSPPGVRGTRSRSTAPQPPAAPSPHLYLIGADRADDTGTGETDRPGGNVTTLPAAVYVQRLRAALAPHDDRDAPNTAGLRLQRESLGSSRAGGWIERFSVWSESTLRGRFIAKSYGDATGARLWGAFAPPARERLPIATPVAYDPVHRVLISAEAPGVRLDGLLADGPAEAAPAEAAMERTGQAVARLHRATTVALDRLRLIELLDALRPQPDTLPGGLGERAGRIARSLRALPDPADDVQVICHRDLHLRQVFVDDRRATLIDLDHSGLGHPALDTANLSIYLRFKHPERAAHWMTAFHRGYGREFGDTDPGALAIFQVFTCLRLAVKTVRRRLPGWSAPATRLIELADQLLRDGVRGA